MNKFAANLWGTLLEKNKIEKENVMVHAWENSKGKAFIMVFSSLVQIQYNMFLDVQPYTLYMDKSSAFALSFPIFVNTTVDKVRLNEFMSV